MLTRIHLNHILLALILPLLVLLSSCYDLGDFKNDDDYLNSFSNVKLYSNFESSDYSFSDFYNENTINDFACPIKEDNYQVLSIAVNKAFVIDDFYIFFSSTTRTSLTMSLYILDSEISIKENEDNDSNQENEKEFVGLDVSYLKETVTSSIGNEFEAIGFNKGNYEIKENQYIVIAFQNNILKDSIDVSFKFTDILIRGIN